jgi:hypothetical protein
MPLGEYAKQFVTGLIRILTCVQMVLNIFISTLVVRITPMLIPKKSRQHSGQSHNIRIGAL